MICGIIGAGTMGRGIAQVAISAGWEVRLFDNHSSALVSAQRFIEKMINRQAEKGKISSQEAVAIFGRLYLVNRLHAFKDCDLVIEAIIEDLEIKKTLFNELEGIVSKDCILATNTSSLSVTSIAGGMQHPRRVLGIHFFNPAPLMKLVEVIPALQTDPDILKTGVDIVNSWSKIPVRVKDTPGFIVNRLARPFYGEALRIFEERVASKELIDEAMKSLGGFKMGPFELMDYIGNDINYKVTETVFKAFYFDGRYKPSFSQLRLVEAGYLGRKSGKGFYDYPRSEKPENFEIDEELSHQVVERILVMLINEAADALYLNIASKEDLDLAMEKGVNYPKGLLKWADEIGIARCVDVLDSLSSFYKEERYRCSPLLRKMAIYQNKFYDS